MSFDLRSARINLGLSQRDLAAQAGVARETIRRLESREGGANPATLKRVADIFGIKPLDLVADPSITATNGDAA
jgi:transcriptional regulator with XRE-family HTH domain